jgi:hypothetical protein
MKTAVEWLANEIQEQLKMFFPNATLYQPTIEKAKEMEKEQMIETYNKAHSDGYKDIDKFGEQYYNETFNKK